MIYRSVITHQTPFFQENKTFYSRKQDVF